MFSIQFYIDGKKTINWYRTTKLKGHKHYFYIFSEMEGSDLAKTSEFSFVTQQTYLLFYFFPIIGKGVKV